MKNKNTKIIGSVVVGIIVAVIIFYGGVAYGKTQVQTAQRAGFGNGAQTGRNGQFSGANGQVRQGQGGTRAGAQARMGGAGFVIGQILSKDATSLTIKLLNGGSQIVFTSASTTISKSSPGTMTDLVVGGNVSVQGNPTSDGSLTAQSIQIR